MTPATSPLGRVLGLDLGDARIGVAISDPERRMALPFGTIHVGQPPGELKAIVAIVREQAIAAVVLGLPLSLSGATGPAARHAQGFAQTLQALLEIPIHLQDERLSTAEAERQLSSSGVGGRERRRVVDRTAATVILQSWLDARPT